MEDQKGVVNKGGTNRLGLYPCTLTKETNTYKAYKSDTIKERHRHRFEYNNDYRADLEKVGLIVSGVNKDLNLVEIVEVKGHPFMVGSQFHPEFLSRPTKPHPLFVGWMKAMIT